MKIEPIVLHTHSQRRSDGKDFQIIEQTVCWSPKETEYIERHWCPTIASTDFTGKRPFRFENDRRL